MVDADKIIEARKRCAELLREIKAYARSPVGQLAGCSAQCYLCEDGNCGAGQELLEVDCFLDEVGEGYEVGDDDEDTARDEAFEEAMWKD